MNKLRTIPTLPKLSIIDMSAMGYAWKIGNALSVRKSLVNAESFLLIQDFVEAYELTLTEKDGHYLLHSKEPIE